MVHNITFQKEIDSLKQKFMVLGSMVEDRLRKTCLAMETGKTDLLKEVAGSDWEINEMEVEVEEECLKILALHQPVARDLRLIIAIIKINSELERIADIAVNMANRTMAVLEEDCVMEEDLFLPTFSKIQIMLKDSLDALVLEDSTLARKILVKDKEINEFRNQVCRQLIDKMNSSPGNAGCHINKYVIAMHMERVGDRCTNIAEEIIYLIEGEIVRGERR